MMAKMWSFPVTSLEDSEKGWNVELPSLWRSAQLGAKAVNSTRRPHTPKEIPWYFCNRLTGPQGYWMRTEGLSHKNIFQGHYRESNPEPRIFWRSAGYDGKRRTLSLLEIDYQPGVMSLRFVKLQKPLLSHPSF